jgi:hypothetical protein
MKPKELPPVELLRKLFDYDAETGIMRWKVKPNPTVNVGDRVGNPDAKRYCLVQLNRQTYQLHRICYKLYHGIDPGHLVIDHINRIKTDNRIVNLRAVTHQVNGQNVDFTNHGKHRNSRNYKPVTINYPDGGQITVKSIQLASFLLDRHVCTISVNLRGDGVVYGKGGRHKPTGITVSYADKM